ncbi:fungal-specific transcription factor domain-containing protein [Lipomyces orientalis]|uniref:Fungal-specific transcription factor domain-containing protein n=1 Tax=Lipomyces orientalis TaxID=1233043 RepID=A0ACC3TH10_9ASCO
MDPMTPQTPESESFRSSEAYTWALQSRRNLPTRVNNACQRCRRHKIRCDAYRPCSLCVRANVACVPVGDATRPKKKMKRSNGAADGSEIAHRGIDISSIIDRNEQRPLSEPDEVELPADVAKDSVTPCTRQSQSSSAVDYQEAPSAMGITRKIFGLHGLNVVERATSAIPDGEVRSYINSASRDSSLKRSISSILGSALPSKEVMDVLLEEYFDSVHWFSLVIFEPRFRPEYESVADGYAYQSQKGFLLLLSTVLGIAAWYRSKKSSAVDNLLHEDWNKWRVNLLSLAEARFLELMDESSLASIQTCLLLGSYYVYHGRPNSSFALLGATIKTAQAMGLHRQPSRGECYEIEERKRIWWTIYTWDRFASVTYGRPLGINDNDCNVAMPADIYERARPVRGTTDDESAICYSAYQRQLNMLYIIVSPLIETIFGLRSSRSGKRNSAGHYAASLQGINQRLSVWREQVPPNLRFNFDCDIQQNAPLRRRAHQLQALALQLTYDNILIILHRPVLVQQIDSLCRAMPVQANDANAHMSSQGGPSPSIPEIVDNISTSVTSSQQWWNAAVRTSGVTTLPNTTQLATDSHLVAFLAIILFNAAIVMVVCALSDPLSDRAQEAKRNITRIFRLEEFLGKQSTLSRQSSIVLQDVIQLLLNRETEVMLAPVAPSRNRVAGRLEDEYYSKLPPSVTLEDVLGDILHEPKVPNDDNNPVPIGFNETLILNESLVSVQKVFPGFSTALTETNSIRSVEPDESSARVQGWQEHFQTDSNAGITEQVRNGPIDYGGVDSGLYWIWDMNMDLARVE